MPRLGTCRFIIALSKIEHKMWRDHPFRKRNKTAWGLVATKKSGGGGGEGEQNIEKVGGVSNIGESS